jgi:hypothetical protein
MPGTYADRVRRVLIGRVVMSSDAAIVLIGSFLPWLRSGKRHRNSYDIFSLVDRIGYSPDGPAGWALRVWPVLPVLLAAALTLLWLGRERVGAGLAAVAAVYAGAVAITVRVASPSGLVSVEYGSWVTLAGAASLLAGTAITIATSPAVAARRAAPWDGRS